MKKSIVLVAVLAFVVGSVFAEANFSGTFSFDYVTQMDGTVSANGADADTRAAELFLGVSEETWDLDIRTVTDAGSKIGDVDATATLKINAILDTVDVTLPVAVNAFVGNQRYAGSSVYADPSGAEGDYAFLSADIQRVNLPLGASVSYEDIVTVKAGFDLIDEGMFLSAVVKPVEGISVAFNIVDEADFDLYQVTGVGISTSAAADIAVLAGLDFDLSVSASGWFAVDDDTKNNYFATVSGGVDSVSLFAEYTNEQEVSNLFFGGRYTISEALNTSVGIGFEDLDDAEVGAWVRAAYTIADISTFVEYGFSGDGDDESEHYIQTGLSFSF
ncbi:MAG: hypothetical protein JXK93_12190 [Sphaerochaetaceae bacterium]|nr:hypothetical protein [Sphaerochaetaceae bacterium]